MKAPYRWLQELLPGLAADADECAKRLTAAGLEVEGVHSTLEGFETVYVGRLLEVNKHPNADKLTVCKVDIAGVERQIVCGARNHKAGDKVAVALPGSVLPNGAKIEKGKIRGEVSDGMLCSEAELGLGLESDGIWILPPDAKEGALVADAMNLSDWILEIGLTPNRGDCLSQAGIARELGAALGLAPKLPAGEAKTSSEKPKIKVRLEDAEGCPRYIARVIEGVKIQPSPSWMQRRLEQCGIRPINNVVDVTNYVMLELGQPLHAFDARMLEGGEIVVRAAKAGEKMKTLDGVERKLLAADLVIADAKKPVAIAGVMGGEHSGVLDDTTTVVLESAWFDPSRVRKTSRAHGLHTESSHRFERNVDPNGVDRASARAAALIAETSGGKVLSGSVDASKKTFEPRKIRLARARVSGVLGVDPTPKETAALLEPLGLACTAHGADALDVVVPTFRPDLTEEIDLVEEVARRYGYEKIPERAPRSRLSTEGKDVETERMRKARGILVGMGFQETLHLPFASRDEAAKLGLAAGDPRGMSVPLANPLADDQAVLRGTLLPVLLANVARNRAKKQADLRLFELRGVFRWSAAADPAQQKLPQESRRVSGVLCGRRFPAHWNAPGDAVDFFDAKGIVETFVTAFTRRTPLFAASSEPFLVTGAQAALSFGGKSLGVVGEVHPDVLARFEVGARAFAFELDYEALTGVASGTPAYVDLPRFPAIERDVALLMDESVAVGDLLQEARKHTKKGLESIDVFDVFRGGKLPPGKKSVALGMVWRAADRTLTDDEVNGLHEKLVQALQERFRAERR